MSEYEQILRSLSSSSVFHRVGDYIFVGNRLAVVTVAVGGAVVAWGYV